MEHGLVHGDYSVTVRLKMVNIDDLILKVEESGPAFTDAEVDTIVDALILYKEINS